MIIIVNLYKVYIENTYSKKSNLNCDKCNINALILMSEIVLRPLISSETKI